MNVFRAAIRSVALPELSQLKKQLRPMNHALRRDEITLNDTIYKAKVAQTWKLKTIKNVEKMSLGAVQAKSTG